MNKFSCTTVSSFGIIGYGKAGVQSHDGLGKLFELIGLLKARANASGPISLSCCAVEKSEMTHNSN